MESGRELTAAKEGCLVADTTENFEAADLPVPAVQDIQSWKRVVGVVGITLSSSWLWLLGLFTIDSQGVPMLIKTLEKLGAIVDRYRSAVVLKATDQAIVILLMRSSTDHLLLSLCVDRLPGGSRMYFQSSEFGEEKGAELTSSASAFVVFSFDVQSPSHDPIVF